MDTTPNRLRDAAYELSVAKELIAEARLYFEPRRESNAHNQAILDAVVALHCSYRGLNEWGHRPVNDGNVSRVAALFDTLHKRGETLKKLLH